jgi:uncharacterized delta-60 repeat protein
VEALEDRCLMSAGALDTTFNPTGSPPGTVTVPSFVPTAVAIETDGKIVAAGTAGTTSHVFGVSRYNGNGSLDTSFNATGTVTTKIGTNATVYDMAIQSDGKILVGGWTSSPYAFALARYTTTGTLDQSFGQHGITTYTTAYGDRAYALSLQPDGKIVLAGDGTGNAGGVTSGIGLVRFNSDGSLDHTFGYGGWVFTPYSALPGADRLSAKDVAIDSAGRLVVAGYMTGGTASGPFVARYNFAGSLDTSLGGTGVIALTQFPDTFNATHEALQTDGKIVLTSTYEVIRLRADGDLDTDSFGALNTDGSHTGHVSTGWSQLDDVQMESDGKIVYVGAGTRRLLSDGSLDSSFGSGGFSQGGVFGDAIAIQPADGNIVIGGSGGLARFGGDMPTSAGASTLGLNYFPSPVRSGLTGTFTVWADNAVVALATGYTGTVHFTSSDPQAVLPADYTFTAADQGAHVFSATLWTPGTQSLFVTDTLTASLTASQSGIVVQRTWATHFSISAPASVTSGVAFGITVMALDAYGGVVAYYYLGTVHATCSDPSATLPANYTFVAADMGVHSFTGLVLRTKGVQTLTITDVLFGTIFGTISVDVV